MKSGVLQQNDLPQRLYNRLTNQFVADFFGNPPINNIPGIIQDGRFVTEDGKGSASLDMCKGVETGRKVNLSVRSESFVLDAGGPILQGDGSLSNGQGRDGVSAHGRM